MEGYWGHGLVSIIIAFYLYKKGAFSGYQSLFSINSHKVILDKSAHWTERVFRVISLSLLLTLLILALALLSLFFELNTLAIKYLEIIIGFLPDFIFSIAILSIALYLFLPKDNSWAAKWVDEQIKPTQKELDKLQAGKENK